MTSPDEASVLSVRDLTIRLSVGAERPEAVSGLSFDIAAGEIFCIVGESGSGKSVTALAIMGLLPPALGIDAGRIEIDGKDTSGVGPAELRRMRGPVVSMIFQDPITSLNPIMCVKDQIDEIFREHTQLDETERNAEVMRLLEEVHLDAQRIAPAFPHQLSGGQAQRIMIAIALALKPRLLIADEPTTALDVTTQAQILKLLRELQEKLGTSVLFITHDFGVVAEIADRVIVMRQGRVVERGARASVLEHPRHDYTKVLINSVPRGRKPTGAAVPRSAKPYLVVEGLNKEYVRRGLFSSNRFVALKDIGLNMDAGEILGVVGESGSGKTTLARCIAQLVPADSGTISIGGQVVSRLHGKELRKARALCQTVFQNPFASLNPRVRIGETIARGPMNFGVSRSDALERARDMLELVGLDANAMHRMPREFSGGQRQRIAIARALVMRPKLLIADEAVSALDVSIQAQIISLLNRIRKEQDLGILFITHDLRVAAELCDRLIVMRNGQIVEQGRASSVLSAPTSSYTRALLDAIPGRDWLGGMLAQPIARST